jgi:hypothetical protein
VIAFKTRRGITPARCFGVRGPVFGMIGRELGWAAANHLVFYWRYHYVVGCDAFSIDQLLSKATGIDLELTEPSRRIPRAGL